VHQSENLTVAQRRLAENAGIFWAAKYLQTASIQADDRQPDRIFRVFWTDAGDRESASPARAG
jgi:hypothetical protein